MWEYDDKPVEQLFGIGRGYTWGPHSFGIKTEPYLEAFEDQRLVQYFDKSRMELSSNARGIPGGSKVTNGLLTKELVTGKRQDGDNTFTQLTPAHIPVAGDEIGNGVCPTYASFAFVVTFFPGQNAASNQVSQPIKQSIDRAGVVHPLDTLPFNLTIGFYEPVLQHNVPDVFYKFMYLSGRVWNGSSYVTAPIYGNNPVAQTFGYPVTEPYWTRAVLAGHEKDVLVQLYERRVLTYTPTNPDPYKVEMGNTGQHYYNWRYSSVGSSNATNG